MIYEIQTANGRTYITAVTSDFNSDTLVYYGNTNLQVKQGSQFSYGDNNPYVLPCTGTVYDNSISTANSSLNYSQIVSVAPRPDLVPDREYTHTDFILIGVLIVCLLSAILFRK